MATVKYVQTRDPDTGQLSEKHLLEVIADNVIFEEENMTLPQKMDTKADKVIYGDDKISKGRYYNSTEGEGSIAFGVNVQAINHNSIALGNNTITNSSEGLVTGRYNIVDSDEKYALIIGNGSLDELTGLPKRSNAFAVDWNGNIYGNKFVDMNGHEALTTLKNIRIGDNVYELHGTTLHLVAGHNIVLNSLEIESEDIDGTTSHVLQVTITADKNAAGDGTGGGVGNGLYLPLVGGTEYGPVIFNTNYDRTKFTTSEREIFIKNSPKYNPNMTEEEKNELLFSMDYIPIVIGDPENIHLDIDCTNTNKSSIDSYNEKTKQGEYLYLNKSKGIIIMGASAGNGILWDPKRRSGGTGINLNNIGITSFGWGTNVSPTGYNSVAFGSTARASGSASLAVGDNTRASGIASVAEGMNTYASATATHAEGSYTYAKGAYSHTEGYGSVILGAYSHAEGYGNNVASHFTVKHSKEDIEKYWNSDQKFALILGDYSHIEGKNNLSLGDYNHIEGIESISYNDNNHIEGGHHYSIGKYNHIEGLGHTNVGHYNHIIGYMHSLKGKYSFVSGMQNIIEGNKNFIFGKNNLIQSNKTIVFGENIYIKTDSLVKHRFIVGNDINIGNNNEYKISNSDDYGTIILGSGFSLYSKTLVNTFNFLVGKKISINVKNEYANNFLLGNNITINSPLNELYTIRDTYIFGLNNNYQNWKSTSNFIFNTQTNISEFESNNNILFLNYGTLENSQATNNLLIGNNNTFSTSIIDSNIILGNNIINENTQLNNSYIYGINIDLSNVIFNNSYIYGTNIDLSNVIFNNVYLETNDSALLNCNIKNIHIEGMEHNANNFDLLTENDIGCAHIEGYQNIIIYKYGMGTHIEGYNNTAGIGSHTEGSSNDGEGDFSHTEGYLNINKGEYSHTEGILNILRKSILISEEEEEVLTAAIHIEGRGCIAGGQYIHIEGGTDYENINELNNRLNSTTWLSNIEKLQRTIGYKYHLSIGKYSHTEGFSNLNLADGSHTEGLYNINNMAESHIEGKYNYNYGIDNNLCGHTEGFGNINMGQYSHIEGMGNILSKDYNITDVTYELWKELNFNFVGGIAAHVEGISNYGIGKGSHVEGYKNAAIGEYSHAAGTLSEAIGRCSISIGIGTLTQYENQYAIGKYNKCEEDYILMIGNGTSDKNRSNIVKISKEGVISANGFELLNGQPITGGSGQELPIGTVITNRNPNSSGIEYGYWEMLGSQEVSLSTGSYILYYWERTKGWIKPDEDEVYYIVGREVPSTEEFNIIGNEVLDSEKFFKE